MKTSRTILNVVGARPNFMKMAPLMRAFRPYPAIQALLVDTGQHYDANMSAVFFEELDIPMPDHALNVGSGSQAVQTAAIMVRFEELCESLRPDAVVVVGDVNSTLACSLVAAKLHIPVAHVEAGLRSGDRTMPEEINRIVTDTLASWLFTPSRDADANLQREGIPADRVFLVGNVMIDSLLYHMPAIRRSRLVQDLGFRPAQGGRPVPYGVVTLHRPSNVDSCESLGEVLGCLDQVQKTTPLVFPVHPRTRANLEACKLLQAFHDMRQLRMIEPAGYFDFLALVASAAFVLTDSGGIQEETTYLNVPCLTLRPSTERPITVTMGTNQLVQLHEVAQYVELIREGRWKSASPIEFWDGGAADRIVRVLADALTA